MAARTADICVIANPKSGAAQRNPGALDAAMAVFGPRAVLRKFSGDPAPQADLAVRVNDEPLDLLVHHRLPLAVET